MHQPLAHYALFRADQVFHLSRRNTREDFDDLVRLIAFVASSPAIPLRSSDNFVF